MLGEIALSWCVRTKGKGEHHNLVYTLIVSLPYKGVVIPVVKQLAASLADECGCQSAGLGAIPVVKQQAASLADECGCQSAGLGADASVHSESSSVRVGKLPVVDMEAGAHGSHV